MDLDEDQFMTMYNVRFSFGEDDFDFENTDANVTLPLTDVTREKMMSGDKFFLYFFPFIFYELKSLPTLNAKHPVRHSKQ